jgi:hypothetical protein
LARIFDTVLVAVDGDRWHIGPLAGVIVQIDLENLKELGREPKVNRLLKGISHFPRRKL